MLVEPGIYHDSRRPWYDAAEALRATLLKCCENDDDIEKVLKEGNPSKVSRLFVPEPSDQDALEFGTMVHERVLERIRGWAVAPECDRRTKAGKELFAYWEQANVGKRAVHRRGKKTAYFTQQRLVGCSLSVQRMIQNEYGAKWRNDSDTELAVIWDEDGLRKKCLIDLFINGEDVVDIKTVGRWPKEGQFLRQIENFGYAIPVLHYLKGCDRIGLTVKRYRWLFIESCFPFRSRFVTCPDWFLENTPARYAKCIANFKRLNTFKAPTEVTLEPEQWWMFRHGEEVQLEGVEDYEE